MPRASWKGFLRLSLVSCPIYLSPATTRTKTIRLNRVWVPSTTQVNEEPEAEPTPRHSRLQSGETATGRTPPDDEDDEETTYAGPATRVALRPHDPQTGQAIERDEVVKGYEYTRGQFVTFTPDELKALDVESSKIIDLGTFVPRADIDPVYFSTPYYVYPDGPVAAEAFRVIGHAMAEVGMAGIGTITLSRRERMAMVEPRGAGLVLITLRSGDEVRAASFDSAAAEVDDDMVAIASMIIKRRSGEFDPSTFRDRYQERLRELVDAKLKGRQMPAPAAVTPPPALDLMAALKRSLADAEGGSAPKGQRKATPDRRQKNLLLPMPGKTNKPSPPPAKREPARRRRKA